MFVLLKSKTHIVCEEIVNKAVKRSLSNSWHPSQAVEPFHKGAIVE